MSQTSSHNKHPPTSEVIASWLGAGGLLADAVGWERVGWQLTRVGCWLTREGCWLARVGCWLARVGWERVGWQLTRVGKRREDKKWPRSDQSETIFD